MIIEPQSVDPSQAFLNRLLVAVQHGQRLDDPRNAEVLTRWIAIAEAIPDSALQAAIPEALRGLLRQPNLRSGLIRCGIAPSLPLQHESVAPYILSWRRYRAARMAQGHSDGGEAMMMALSALRVEIRDHLETYRPVFDHIAGLDQGYDRAVPDDASLQQRLLAQSFSTTEPAGVSDIAASQPRERRAGSDVVTKALRLYRLHLYTLKEERGDTLDRLPNPRLIAAEFAVESQAATLNALGHGADAVAEAETLLGPSLALIYVTIPTPDDPLPSPPARHQEALPDNIHVFRPRGAL